MRRSNSVDEVHLEFLPSRVSGIFQPSDRRKKRLADAAVIIDVFDGKQNIGSRDWIGVLNRVRNRICS